MKKLLLLPLLMIIIISCTRDVKHKAGLDKSQINSKSLVILWTSGDPEVFEKIVFPYGLNSKKENWWQDVELLIWGPSTKLLSENPDLQDKIKTLKKAGLILTSCLWCADQYKATELLKQLGVDVKYMGKPLTEYLQSGKQVITF